MKNQAVFYRLFTNFDGPGFVRIVLTVQYRAKADYIMEHVDEQNRLRWMLLTVFVALGILALAGWAFTGQREVFETPALFFSATGLIISFGFF